MEICKPEDRCDDCILEDKDKEEVKAQVVKLSEYRPGEKGIIKAVCGNPEFRLRLMEMGFIRGTEVKVVKCAPLTDPVEFVIKGYHVSLRRNEAAGILMDQPLKAA